MTDSQEKSDDLIAELAKLMATNAQGSENEAKPTVIKLAPLSEVSRPTGPVRIPGGVEAPAVRIPGMDRAVSLEAPATAAPPQQVAPAAEPRPVATAPVPQTVDRNIHEAAVTPPAPRPLIVPPATPDTAAPGAPQQRFSPVAQPEADTAADSGDFKFDFGFGSGQAGAGTVAQPASTDDSDSADPAHDPIAELIAGELQAAAPVVPEAVPAARPAPPAPVLRMPGQATPTESDKFVVAPVLGLGSKPTSDTSAPQAAPRRAAAPSAGDPMAEIENLIGEAVRREVGGSAAPKTEPDAPVRTPAAPVVPPLGTGFAPRRAGLKDREPQVQSAEAAILAAAADTGAEVGRVETAPAEDRAYRRAKPEKRVKANRPGGLRPYLGMAVAGTLLVAAGFGLYWVMGVGSGDATAPVLTADASPVKRAPAVAATTAEPARSVVFDEIDGVAAAAESETLVSRDETAGADVTEVARVVAPEAADSGLANRKVRTVTVRPDGTIVSGDDAIAGTEALPVDRPNVPDVPGAASEPSDLLTAAASALPDTAAPASVEADPIASAIAEAEAPADTTPLALAALAPGAAATAPAGTDPLDSEAPRVFDASIVPPAPMPRPTDRSALNAGGATDGIATASVVEPNAPASLPLVDLTGPVAQPAPTSGGNAAAYVQLFSQRSEGEAQASLQSAQNRYGSLFNGRRLEIQRADLGARGIYYRVLAPATSRAEAVEMCTTIKANGGDCFVP